MRKIIAINQNLQAKSLLHRIKTSQMQNMNLGRIDRMEYRIRVVHWQVAISNYLAGKSDDDAIAQMVYEMLSYEQTIIDDELDGYRSIIDAVDEPESLKYIKQRLVLKDELVKELKDQISKMIDKKLEKIDEIDDINGRR